MQSTKRLYGLAVCGGKSNRMGMDKSLLEYHGRPQRDFIYTMLATLCDETFISCNAEQAGAMNKQHKTIVDKTTYAGNGPMAGLLSAFDLYPGADWLIAGCDYPYLTRQDMNDFVKSIDTNKPAAAFYNEQQQIYEPLLAWYSYAASDELKKMFARKEYSLQHFLKKINAGKFLPADRSIIQSVDTREEYERVKNDLAAKAQLQNSSQQFTSE